MANDVKLEVGQIWHGKTPKGNPDNRTITGTKNHLPDVFHGEFPQGFIQYSQDRGPNAWAEIISFLEWSKSATLQN